MKRHWELTYGEGGISYFDYSSAHYTRRDALDSAFQLYELDYDQKVELIANGYLRWPGDTTHRIKVRFCDCFEPWIHEEKCDDYQLQEWLEWLAEEDELEVVDGCNAYYLYRGKESACMGDGVDTEFTHPLTGRPVTVGQPLFALLWQREINNDPGDYVEAYFG